MKATWRKCTAKWPSWSCLVTNTSSNSTRWAFLTITSTSSNYQVSFPYNHQHIIKLYQVSFPYNHTTYKPLGFIKLHFLLVFIHFYQNQNIIYIILQCNSCVKLCCINGSLYKRSSTNIWICITFPPQLFETKLDACSLLSELGLRYYCFVGICVHVVIMDYIMFARL